MINRISLKIGKFLNFFLYFIRKIYLSAPNEFRKRVISAMILSCFFLGMIIRGGVYYNISVLAICVILTSEMFIMLAGIRKDNINFYESYKKWGLFIIISFGISLVLIRDFSQGKIITIWMFGIIWTCDAAAYLLGSKYGKFKLAPNISPKKTYEGAFFGLICGFITSVILYKFFLTKSQNSMDFDNFCILTIIILILSQMSDLAESWLKRKCNVANSGFLIPGHGGFLDRFDSIIIPSMFIYILVLIKSGHIF